MWNPQWGQTECGQREQTLHLHRILKTLTGICLPPSTTPSQILTYMPPPVLDCINSNINRFATLKRIITFRNQKPWMNRGVQLLPKARDTTGLTYLTWHYPKQLSRFASKPPPLCRCQNTPLQRALMTSTQLHPPPSSQSALRGWSWLTSNQFITHTGPLPIHLPPEREYRRCHLHGASLLPLPPRQQ